MLIRTTMSDEQTAETGPITPARAKTSINTSSIHFDEVSQLKGMDRTSWELANGLIENNDGMVPCASCRLPVSPDNSQNCLRSATQFGQRPSSIIFYDGIDPHHPLSALVDAHTPKTFQVTTPLILPPTGENLASPRSPFAALTYATSFLETKNCFVFGSTSSPMAHELVDYWTSETRDRFDDPRLQETAHIYRAAAEAAARLGKQSLQDIYNLASIELLRWNASQLSDISHNSLPVTAALYNSLEGNLTAFTPHDSLMDLFNGRTGDVLNVPSVKTEPGTPLAYCCLCCDARAADGSRVFGRDRVLHSNSISVLIPPYDPDDLTWMGIMRATRKGAPLTIVMGHSDCGGIKSLVAMEQKRRSGSHKSFGPYIDSWLAQASPIVADVFQAVYDNPDIFRDMTQKIMCELVARRVKMWSATNVSNGTGKPAIACFQHLDRHKVEFLPLTDTLRDTYERIIRPERKIYMLGEARKSTTPRECVVRKTVIPTRPYAWLLGLQSPPASPQTFDHTH